ncbi:MAG: 1-acyl-sn-glycerol-3-phosphate acyltransferase [Lachnospiraceae bacterium]|nr:1-acyl-sn-glycerol-3-phosphate acyltransferase [Lachnospiraceae bacterium]
MIRLILVALYVALFLILTMPLMLASWIIGKFNSRAADKLANSVVMWGFRCVWFICGIKLDVRGREKVPADKSLLYVSNHRSLFDIVIGYPLCKCPTGVISKKSIKKIPLLNIWMMLLKCLFLDRSNTKKGLEVILKAIELEKEGVSILIFPEGTRIRDYTSDKLLPMHNGSFKIATKSGAMIQPITMVGTENIMAKHMPFVRSAKVTVVFGDPIDPSQLDKDTLKNIGAYVGSIIEDTYSSVIKEGGKASR